jgi:hypothetical protein
MALEIGALTYIVVEMKIKKWLLTSSNRHWCSRIYFIDLYGLAIV